MCGSPPSRRRFSAVRIAYGDARLLLGCDLVVSASGESVSKLRPGHSQRDRQQPPDHHRRLHPQPRPRLSRAGTEPRRGERGRPGRRRIPRRDRARHRPPRRLAGDQPLHARLRLSARAGAGLGRGDRPGDRAQRRRGRLQPPRLSLGPPRRDRPRPRRRPRHPARGACRRRHRLSEALDEAIARRAEFLTAYQNPAYAARYTAWVERIRAAEAAALPGNTALTDASRARSSS